MTDSPLPPTTPPAVPSAPQPAPMPDPAGSPVPVEIVKKGNGLGLASLIVGVIALIGSFIPFLNYATGVVAFVSLVLGVVALLLKGRAKAVAIAGTAVSVVALLLSIILAIVYTAGFIGAVADAGVKVGPSEVAVGPEAEPTPVAGEEQGTRTNPYPLGTSLSFTEAGAPFYDVTVGASTLNANDLVAAENQFNEPAPAGTQFAMLPLTVTYTGSETGTPWIDLGVDFVAADGTTHSSSDVFAVGPAPLTALNELYTGGSGTGNVLVNIPSANAEQGTWLLRVGFITGEEVFFAAQ